MSIDSIHDIHEQCHGGTVSLSVWNEVTANCRNLLLLKKFSTSGSRIQNQAYTCSTWFTEFCLQEIITLNFSVVKPPLLMKCLASTAGSHLCGRWDRVPVPSCQGKFSLSDARQNVVGGVIWSICKWCVPIKVSQW